MQQEFLEFHALHVVHTLLIHRGAERHRYQGLGFAAGEQGAAMGAGQQADVTGDGTDRRHVAAVDAHLVLDNHAAHHALFDLADQAGDFAFLLGIFFCQGFLDRIADLIQSRIALLLGADLHSLENLIGAQLVNLFLQCHIGLGNFKLAFGLTHQVAQFDLQIDQRLQGFVSEKDRFEHFILGQQLCLPLDHDDRLAGTCHRDVEIAVFHLLKGRICHQFAIHPADTHGGNGPVERDVGHFHCRRSRDDGESVRIVDQVGGNHRRHDLGFIHVPFGEQGAHGAVDQTADEGFPLAGAAFATEEGARDFAGGIEFFLVVDGQGKEILPFPHFARRNDGTQNLGLTIGDHHGTVGLTSHFPGFNGQRLSVELCFYFVKSHTCSFGFGASTWFKINRQNDQRRMARDRPRPSL